MQKSGAFKFRGATNAVKMLTQQERDKGLVTASGGNHALGISMSGKSMGVKKTLVYMPEE